MSSQGNDSYAVYRREGKQEYLGSFAVVADPLRGIDGISETDGLEITSRNLGPGFEHGAMTAQDGRNVMPVENQNYKYVPWQAIAEALGLEAVSYTHLDVYKRQSPRLPGKPTARWWCAMQPSPRAATSWAPPLWVD